MLCPICGREMKGYHHTTCPKCHKKIDDGLRGGVFLPSDFWNVAVPPVSQEGRAPIVSVVYDKPKDGHRSPYPIRGLLMIVRHPILMGIFIATMLFFTILLFQPIAPSHTKGDATIQGTSPLLDDIFTQPINTNTWDSSIFSANPPLLDNTPSPMLLPKFNVLQLFHPLPSLPLLTPEN